MGRLFWKFFFFTMLAQILATISVGGAIWLKDRETRQRTVQIDMGPPASTEIESAASTLQYGGVEALRNLLRKLDHRHPIVAVDDSNHELLGRPVDPQTLSEAREIVSAGYPEREVQEATSQDGAHYLLFGLSRPRPDNQFGAPGPGTGPNGGPNVGPNVGQNGGQNGGPNGGPGPAQMNIPNGPLHGGPMMPLQPFLGVTTAILASLIFAWLLARYVSKPIRSLREAFGAIANGNLNTRLDGMMGRRSDELADLGRDFDAMAERLRSLVNEQRRILHEVSHELRSPLARLQVAIGLARQQPDKIESSLVRIERESARMEKLVAELLTLSRLATSEVQLERVDIDFAGLVAHVVEDARFEAEANHRKLELVGHCAVAMQGDTELLRRAIENVIRNAVKHTAVDTSVVVVMQEDEQHNAMNLVVMDRGPGVQSDELQAIFEPFYRGASTVRNSDGHGIGLAIAYRVVTSHGGHIVASNRDEGGLKVVISLPLAPKPIADTQ